VSTVQRSTFQHSNAEALFPVTTDGEDETLSLGAALAERLGSGAVVALYGDLGTGKTHFVKGIAKGLGVPPTAVRSPTFTILNTYDGGRRPLHHFDAYRVQTPDEFVELGFEEYVRGEGITCIEWADRISDLLPPDTVHLQFHHVAPSERRITFGAPDAAASGQDR